MYRRNLKLGNWSLKQIIQRSDLLSTFGIFWLIKCCNKFSVLLTLVSLGMHYVLFYFWMYVQVSVVGKKVFTVFKFKVSSIKISPYKKITASSDRTILIKQYFNRVVLSLWESEGTKDHEYFRLKQYRHTDLHFCYNVQNYCVYWI